MNPFELALDNAERDKQAKRDALKTRNNKIMKVDFGAHDSNHSRAYPIEDEIQTRGKCADFRTHLTASENMIAQAERDCLSRVSLRGLPNRSTYEKEVCYTYIFDGVEITEYETITLHDTDVIASQIQDAVGSYGVKSMSKYDIYDILNTVSRVYTACDMLDIARPAVYADNRKTKAA